MLWMVVVHPVFVQHAPKMIGWQFNPTHDTPAPAYPPPCISHWH